MGISDGEVTPHEGSSHGFRGKGFGVLVDAGRREAVFEEGREVGAPIFVTADTRPRGDFRCADCGYGISPRHSLPSCPMCGGATWAGASLSSSGQAGSSLSP